MTTLSVILITYKRPELFKKALETLESAISQAPLSIDVHILINGPDLQSLDLCETFKKQNRTVVKVKALSNRVTPAEARNILVEGAMGSWLFFMDDDVQIPPDIFKNFDFVSRQKNNVELWGGPNLTPLNSEYEAHRNGWFVENFLIVGFVSRRYRKQNKILSKGNQFNLMLCNLFVKSDLFKKELFSRHLKTAEENDLIYRIQKQQKYLGYSDSLFVWHERRPSLQVFLKQIFYYGYGRGQLLVTGRLIQQWYFIFYPVFIFSIFLFFRLFPQTVTSLFFLWILLIQFSYIQSFKRIDFKTVFIPPIIWILYSLGMVKGLLEGLKFKGKRNFKITLSALKPS